MKLKLKISEASAISASCQNKHITVRQVMGDTILFEIDTTDPHELVEAGRVIGVMQMKDVVLAEAKK